MERPKELNLAASPALRRLFGRVIDAVGSAVSGMQESEGEGIDSTSDHLHPQVLAKLERGHEQNGSSFD